MNSVEETWKYKAAAVHRSPAMASIQSGGCDVDCVTERRGGLHSLMCTKNRNSYDRRVSQRKQDLEDLAAGIELAQDRCRNDLVGFRDRSMQVRNENVESKPV
jgi:hypothetical protein